MKKEILRISHLSVEYSSALWLKDISFCAFQGDLIGLVGLADSGKSLIVKMLTGQLPEDLPGKSLYINGKRIRTVEDMDQPVYHFTALQYPAIENWTAAEYVGMQENGWLLTNRRKKKLIREIDAYFLELGIEFDSSRRFGELTELEKRVTDVVKARKLGKTVLMIEDEFEEMKPEEIRQFGEILKLLISDRMAVLVSSYSDIVLRELTESYIIFRKGEIAKKCRRSFITDQNHLEKFMLTAPEESGKKDMSNYVENEHSSGNGVFFLNCTVSMEKERKLLFQKGEITTLLLTNREEKMTLFEVLTGRLSGEKLYCTDENGQILRGTLQTFLDKRIASVMHLGSREELFDEMSVGENLLLPSLRKFSATEFLMAGEKLEKVMHDNAMMQLNVRKRKAKHLQQNEIIALTLERWFILRPAALILFEPFLQCDVYGVSVVKSYLKQFAAIGTTVVIVKSREEYMADITDRMIYFDNFLR